MTSKVDDKPLVVSRILKRNFSGITRELHWVGISDDRSRMQIREMKYLRTELRRRIGAGESNIDIKYISGKPRIINVSNDKISKN